jgi:hypothetical protein
LSHPGAGLGHPGARFASPRAGSAPPLARGSAAAVAGNVSGGFAPVKRRSAVASPTTPQPTSAPASRSRSRPRPSSQPAPPSSTTAARQRSKLASPLRGRRRPRENISAQPVQLDDLFTYLETPRPAVSPPPRFRPATVRRVHIPKGDGRKMRPIGVSTFEDKVRQRAVTMVLEPICEQGFLPCSYGLRPGRSAQQAPELWYAVMNVGGGRCSRSTSSDPSTPLTTRS